MSLIEVTEVKKQYGERFVVNGVSFQIEKGEVFGLLGPNGAGKTTMISMISAQLEVTEGSIRINGLDAIHEAFNVKRLVGVVPQDIALYPMLNAYENLEFFGALYGLKRKELKERIDWILELVGLKDRAKEALKNYSGGMKRRINIAAALLHNPLVVFMDEPTVGIDPQSRNRIYELIHTLKEQGMTIIYTTHYMEEATALCDRIAIIDNGTVIEYGSTRELIEKVHGGILELTVSDPETAEKINSLLKDLDCIVESQVDSLKVSLIVKETQKSIGTVMDCLNRNSLQVGGMNVMPPTLETLFLNLTGKTLRE